MPKAIVSSEERGKMPEALQAEYQPRGDEHPNQFILKVDEVDGFGLVGGGLRSALEQERQNSRTLSTQMKKFEGIDPDKARDALSKVDEMKNWTPDDKVKARVEQAVNEVRSNMETKVTQAEARNKTLMGALRETMLESQARTELAKHSDTPDLLLPHVLRQLNLHEEEGKEGEVKFSVEVLGDKGAARVAPDGKGNMTVAHLVEEMKKQPAYAPAFRGSGSSGGGSRPGSGGGQGGQFTLSSEDAKNPAKYRAAKAQADKAGATLEITE